ncbi:hypothetical protein IQ07DRAFT_595887 [Pyrenochaeta sp. DS3sAY3a]|nr:hypothetical protein IQ07DRAFT_595887 [Pyrenochaeta sp. DS3sAY3a]
MCPPSDLAASHGYSTQPHPDIDSIIPQTQISKSAYDHASNLLDPAILNHSVRVYVYAKAIAQHTSSIYSSDSAKHDLLFTACLFHDIGTTATYDGTQRFEVEGADAAVKHLSQFNVGEADKHDVWTSIAIHTSPGIAEKIAELSCIVRQAVLTDFGRKTIVWDAIVPLKEKLESEFARAEIEKVLGDAVVEQAKSKPEKAPMASWPGVMYKAYLAEPEWVGVNKGF